MKKCDFDIGELLSVQVPQSIENLKLPTPELLTFYKSLDERTIWIDFNIDETLLCYSRYIIEWNKQDKGIPVEERKPIRLMIFSYGGSLDACNHFIDVIKMSKTPVYGYNVGIAMSAGCLIYVSCHKRFCTKHSTALIHQGSSKISGSANDVIQNVENYKRTLDEMQKFILENTNITLAMFKKHSKDDWYITADDQLKYGLAESVIEDIDSFY